MSLIGYESFSSALSTYHGLRHGFADSPMELLELPAQSRGVYKKEKALSYNAVNHATLYYPSLDNGETVDGTNLTVIGFCHGTAIDASDYEYLFLEWVLGGKYIVVANTFPYDGLFDMDTFGDATATYIKGCQGIDGYRIPKQPEILENKVNVAEYKVAGHSLGGGAAAYTASRYAACSGLIGISPATDLGSKVDKAFSKLFDVPTLLLTGTADSVIKSSEVKDKYDLIPGEDKYFGNINGATHCHFTSPTDRLCERAEYIVRNKVPSIPVQQQRAAAAQLSRQFFDNSSGVTHFFFTPNSAFGGDARGTTWNETNVGGQALKQEKSGAVFALN